MWLSLSKKFPFLVALWKIVGLGLQQTPSFFFLSSSLFGCVGMALLPQILTSLEARFGDPKFMSALHLWRIAANVLPTKEVISMFNENMDGSCPLCNSVLELPFV